MLEFAFTALALGMKHSLDADHLAGVSGVLAKSRSLSHTVRMAASWAAGHMLTATIITVLIFLFRESVLSLVLEKMEMLVALMLIAVGAWSLYQSRIFHAHPHEHAEKMATCHQLEARCYPPPATGHKHLHLHLKPGQTDHSHQHMFGIGIVHGLASNDELLLLLTVSLGLASVTDMVIGTAVFSIGVVLGMIAFGIFLTYPMLKLGSERLNKIVNVATGSISIFYGVWMLVGF